jgi:nitronate monooxygenase
VANGAGGHAGLANPFSFLSEIRSEFDGGIALAGGLTNGRHVAAVRAAGADFAYIGTRFIATEECYSPDAYKKMLIEAALGDIVYTPSFSGVHGNYIRQSIEAAGLDPENLPDKKIDFGKDIDAKKHAWKDIWSAGHGVSDIHEVLPVAELVARMREEYREASESLII